MFSIAEAIETAEDSEWNEYRDLRRAAALVGLLIVASTVLNRRVFNGPLKFRTLSWLRIPAFRPLLPVEIVH